MKTFAIDWSHDADNLAVYDGKKITRKLPRVDADLVIVTENLPVKYAKPFLQAGARIFRCNTNLTEDRREELGLEKSHEVDAKILWEAYQDDPESFREMKVDPLLHQFQTLYGTFKRLQAVRVATGNQLYAEDDALAESILVGIEQQEHAVLKGLQASLKDMPIYSEFLEPIKGIGPAVSAGLLAYVGDINRFPTVSHLWSYFGLDVRDGKAPKKARGQRANWHHKGRSLILGVIASSFVKCRTPLYRDLYDEEKAKQIPKCDSLLHADRRAKRKAAKEFLKHFFVAYKALGRGAVTIKTLAEDAPLSKTRKKRAYKQKKLVTAA